MHNSINYFLRLKSLTLKPFDVSTELGRSKERYRLASLTVLTNVISRGIALLVMVLMVRLTAPYLGAERFGAWMTIASFIGVLTFLDMGVGNALTNKVANVSSQKSLYEISGVISGGLGFLLIIGIVVSIILSGISAILPWEYIIKVDDEILYKEIRESTILFSVLFGFYIVTNGIQRIFIGLQRAYEWHISSAAGTLITLLLLFYAVDHELGIPALLMSTMGMQVISGLALLFLLAKRKLLKFNNFIGDIRKESMDLVGIGGLFLILQIGVMIGWGSDSLIISSTLGASEVAVFAIVQKLFLLATQPISMLNAPLWGAYADAHGRGEKQFIKKTLIKTMKITFFFVVATVFFILIINKPLIGLWTSSAIIIPTGLMLAYASWVILDALGNTFAMFLNGCNVVRPQVIAVCALCLVSIPAKFFLINNYGVEAMVFGFSIIYLTIFTILYGYLYKNYLISILQ